MTTITRPRTGNGTLKEQLAERVATGKVKPVKTKMERRRELVDELMARTRREFVAQAKAEFKAGLSGLSVKAFSEELKKAEVSGRSKLTSANRTEFEAELVKANKTQIEGNAEAALLREADTAAAIEAEAECMLQAEIESGQLLLPSQAEKKAKGVKPVQVVSKESSKADVKVGDELTGKVTGVTPACGVFVTCGRWQGLVHANTVRKEGEVRNSVFRRLRTTFNDGDAVAVCVAAIQPSGKLALEFVGDSLARVPSEVPTAETPKATVRPEEKGPAPKPAEHPQKNGCSSYVVVKAVDVEALGTALSLNIQGDMTLKGGTKIKTLPGDDRKIGVPGRDGIIHMVVIPGPDALQLAQLLQLGMSEGEVALPGGTMVKRFPDGNVRIDEPRVRSNGFVEPAVDSSPMPTREPMPESRETRRVEFGKGDIVAGRVVEVRDYGVIMALEGGTRGLVHISTMPGELDASKETRAKLEERVVVGSDVAVRVLELGPKGPSLQFMEDGANDKRPKAEDPKFGEVFEAQVARVSQHGDGVVFRFEKDGKTWTAFGHLSAMGWSRGERESEQALKERLSRVFPEGAKRHVEVLEVSMDERNGGLRISVRPLTSEVAADKLAANGKKEDAKSEKSREERLELTLKVGDIVEGEVVRSGPAYLMVALAGTRLWGKLAERDARDDSEDDEGDGIRSGWLMQAFPKGENLRVEVISVEDDEERSDGRKLIGLRFIEKLERLPQDKEFEREENGRNGRPQERSERYAINPMAVETIRAFVVDSGLTLDKQVQRTLAIWDEHARTEKSMSEGEAAQAKAFFDALLDGHELTPQVEEALESIVDNDREVRAAVLRVKRDAISEVEVCCLWPDTLEEDAHKHVHRLLGAQAKQLRLGLAELLLISVREEHPAYPTASALADAALRGLPLCQRHGHLASVKIRQIVGTEGVVQCEELTKLRRMAGVEGSGRVSVYMPLTELSCEVANLVEEAIAKDDEERDVREAEEAQHRAKSETEAARRAKIAEQCRLARNKGAFGNGANQPPDSSKMRKATKADADRKLRSEMRGPSGGGGSQKSKGKSKGKGKK